MDDGSIWRCLSSSFFQCSSAELTGNNVSFGSIAVYLILIVLLIAGGAFFAGAETALASANRARMKSRAEDGDKKAQYVMYILNNFDKALSTILIGNNVMHIACASIATLLTRKLFYGSSALDTALVVSTILTTIIVFLVAEMLPKCHAKTCSEAQALRYGKALYILMKVLAPLSAVFTWIGLMLKKLFNGKRAEQPTVTEEDLKDMIVSFKDEREEDEASEASTAELMANALEFGATTAGEALTPWEKVQTISTTLPIQTIYQKLKSGYHSRYPVLNAAGKVVGVLNIRTFLRAYMRDGEDMELIDLIDTPLFVRSDTNVDDLLTELSHNKLHLAFISDQGELKGIITIEDILEELVGEIFDETDAVQTRSNV